jgi:NAD(P)-dependent dehydrogenase (short-subunit alcohol dehydrogenase family)
MTDVSVITGGAGGIGLATAKIVVREHPVVICDVSAERLSTAIDALRGDAIDAVVVRCDITDRDSVAGLIQSATSLGTVVSLIHTAGVSPSMGSAELIMKINAVGTVNVNEAFLPHAQEGFVSVNVASMAAYLVPRIVIPKSVFIVRSTTTRFSSRR